MRLQLRARSLLVGLSALTMMLAGCSSGGSGNGTTSTSGPTTTLSRSAVRHEVNNAYATLFNFGNKEVAPKIAAVEDGARLAATLRVALASSLATHAAGARVLSVQALSASQCSQAAVPSPCAKVSYQLLSPSGKPLFPTPSVGYAVEVDGHWLVARSTICGLLSLFYSASGKSGTPSGC